MTKTSKPTPWLGPCEWCRVAKVKSPKNIYCSISCASSAKIERWKHERGWTNSNMMLARRTKASQRLSAEFDRKVGQQTTFTRDEVRRLYARARHIGYKSGYVQGYRRGQRAHLEKLIA